MQNWGLKYILLFLSWTLFFSRTMAQDSILVSGTVLYSDSEPVSEVSISIENDKRAPVYTDSAGHFTIEVPDDHSWLLVNPVQHFSSQRIFVGKKRVLKIYLSFVENESRYDKLQTHLGNMEKRNLISSTEYWEKKKFANYGFSSIEPYMNGTITGFYNINQTSMPGSGSFSSIRGLNSIYATNQPLYIIDGVIMEKPGIYTNQISGYNYNPVTSINPEDISSVTVLKDGSATAVYGMKGSNGVIIIETLKTTEEKTKINLNAFTGISMIPENIPVLNADQYRNYGHELLQSVHFYEENIQNTYPGLLIDGASKNVYDYRNNSDWQKMIYRYGRLSNVYLSIRGGDAIAKYGISFSTDQYKGVLDNTNSNRMGFRMVGNINVLPKLRLYMNAFFNSCNENLVEDMTEEQVSLPYIAMVKPPILAPYVFDKYGNPTNQLMDPLEFNISNPLAVSKGYIGEVNNIRILGSFRLEADLTDRLKFQSILSLNKNNISEQVYFPNIGVSSYDNGEVNNISKRSHNNLNGLYNNTYLEYSGKNSGPHDLYFTTGLRVSSTLLQTDLRIAKNLPENDAVHNLGDGDVNLRIIGGDTPSWTWVSYYASGRYAYRDKYLLDAVMALNGSSTIGKMATGMVNISDQPYGLFYSAGAGWRLSEEDFLEDVPAIDELKIRASYSVSGNDDIGVYSALDSYTQILYREVAGIVPGRTINEGIKNETMNMVNIGADISLWGEKVYFTSNLFRNRTDNLFLQTRTEGWIWDELLARNSGSSTTIGMEIKAGVHLKLGNRIKWNSSFQTTKLHSVINEIYKDKVVIDIDGGQIVYESGNSFPQFYGYAYDGVYSRTEEAKAAGLINDENIPYQAGDAIFEDISGPKGVLDKKISDYDKKALGSPVPELFGGWMNRVSFGRWIFDLNFQFVSGNRIFNYKRYLAERMVNFSNQSAHIEQRWKQEGDQTNTPRALLGDDIGNAAFSSRWIEDGSYIRLKSASFRYVIPEKFILFKNAEFYLTGNNLYTVTKYLGDPEVGRGYQNYQQGIDYGLLPNLPSLILGIKLGL